MEFKDSLREARKAAGLTQGQVAELMNITKSTYCGYETGKRQPDVAKIKQISDILGIPADKLLQTGHAISSQSLPPRDQKEDELVQLFRNMTPEERDMVTAVMKSITDRKK